LAARQIDPIHQSNFKRERARQAAAPQAMVRRPNSRPSQGAVAAAGGVDPKAAVPAPAGGDWRTQLQPETRSRMVNKM